MLLQRKYEGLPSAIGAMGPTYVKFGQALASRSDIVGIELAAALAALQDDLPPFPDSEARRTVDEELPEAHAALVGPPVAAASLCQVSPPTSHPDAPPLPRVGTDLGLL